jgi:hypothetical protein
MSEFWTCGPFKESVERSKRTAFRMEQMKILMDILEENKINQELMENGTPDEQLLATMIQSDIDKKIGILLGVPDGREKKTDEISREAVLEFIDKGPTE